MGKQHSEITPVLKQFIESQKIFFVGTAANEGTVNISPKGMDTFRVVNSNKIVWLNLTGSGNETAAHLLLNDRMTIMFCAFEGKPVILRLYGNAKIYHERDPEFSSLINLFPSIAGTRQLIEMEVDIVQTSCGFSVPIMKYKEDRTVLESWAAKKGKKGIEEYWEDQNTKSIDGFDTHILG